jgi:hypothetical protein
MAKDPMQVFELFEFIKARHQIYIAKQAGFKKPWSDDLILQKYRFTNAYRELDKVTVWISKNWRTPNAKDPHLWFAMVVARFINLPETLEHISYPSLSSDKDFTAWGKKFIRAIEYRQNLGELTYNPAYIVSTNGRKMLKHEYLLEQVFTPAWQARDGIENVITRKGATLADLHAELTTIQGLGSFMAAQVIADVKYAQMKKAPDWWTWAASGPGSRRGLNRIICRDKDTPWREAEWLETLQILHERISGMLAAEGMPQMHAQDLQSIGCCEFDKYERVRLGEGRPKSLYPGI